MPSGRPGITAARSPRVRPVSSALTRIYIFCFGWRASSMPRVTPRAATFWSGAIESSRSRIRASAAVFFALSNFRTLSPGTKRNDLIGIQAFSDSSFGLAMHQARAAAACDHLAMLIGRGVLEFDDALGRSRFAGALGNDFGVRLERIAMKRRF